jgi:hypothetical protein
MAQPIDNHTSNSRIEAAKTHFLRPLVGCGIPDHKCSANKRKKLEIVNIRLILE